MLVKSRKSKKFKYFFFALFFIFQRIHMKYESDNYNEKTQIKQIGSEFNWYKNVSAKVRSLVKKIDWNIAEFQCLAVFDKVIK